MTDNIKVFKQNHIRINAGGKVIHVDPFMADTESRDADFVLITHDHYDHFSPEDINKVAKKDAVLIVPMSMRHKAEDVAELPYRVALVKPGKKYEIYGLRFETVPAYNIGKPFHPKTAGWVGYVIDAEGERIYIAGDTDATDDAKAVKCDTAIVPVGGTYTMNAEEAARLVHAVKPKVAIPVHYGGIVGKKDDGEKFARAVGEGTDVVLKIKF